MAALRTAYLWAVWQRMLSQVTRFFSSPPYGGGGLEAGRQDKVFLFCWSWQNCRTVVWLYLAASHKYEEWRIIHMLTYLIENIIPLSLSLCNYSLYWLYRPGENWGMLCTGSCYSATGDGVKCSPFVWSLSLSLDQAEQNWWDWDLIMTFAAPHKYCDCYYQ